jgi:hypothetical protein
MPPPDQRPSCSRPATAGAGPAGRLDVAQDPLPAVLQALARRAESAAARAWAQALLSRGEGCRGEADVVRAEDVEAKERA